MGAGSCEDREEDRTTLAPTFLPRVAWVIRGARSPWGTSGMGWPTAGKPCVGTAGEAGGGHVGTGRWDGVPWLTAVPRQPRASRLNPLPRSEPVGSAGSVSPPYGRMEMGATGT